MSISYIKRYFGGTMETINAYLSGSVVPIVLTLYAIFFLIKLKGAPIIHFKSMFKRIRGNDHRGEGSAIRAVIFALAGTLGVGNIVGVASAIALGGAGSVFWMWVSAFLAMILKYSEVVLAILHRRMRGSEYYGGAMYYMLDFFTSCKRRGAGYIYTLIFVLLCLCNGVSMGCMIQSDAIVESGSAVLPVSKAAMGIVLCVIAIIVFLFNGKKIFSLCERLVPFVSILYILMSGIVIFLNSDKLIPVFNDILFDAFTFESAGAGIMGFLISKSLRFGTIRGLFSNEAGCGTAPIAHATSNTDCPAEQGFLGIIEVFVDTIIVCTMTALVILTNKEVAFLHTDNPIMMVFLSFEVTFGYAGDVLLFISIFLFALATVICWGYYGKECVYFIVKDKSIEKVYYIIYTLFIFGGVILPTDFIWEIADLAVGGMTVMNLIILGFMNKEIVAETNKYFKKKGLQK